MAVVAGPDPGHAFPAVALCLRLQAAGECPVLITGARWLDAAGAAGLEVHPLHGLGVENGDDDTDAGSRLHARAARMSTLLLPQLSGLGVVLVVSDVLTACGGLAAERAGLPWVELSPHPLYLPSRGLPPVGSGLAPGVGRRGRARDRVLRALTARSVRQGSAQRTVARLSVGLGPHDRGPAARLIATLPALELPRPDWPTTAHVVGPLGWEPGAGELVAPPGNEPLVLVSPSTAHGGTPGLLEAVLAGLAGVRVVSTRLPGMVLPAALPGWAVVGPGRQESLLAHVRVTVCGGGHGILAKSLLAGVPVVLVPGGGDQWELSRRAARQGSALVVRPLTPAALAAAVHRVLTEPSFTRAAQAAARSVRGVEDPVAVCRAVVGR